MQAMLDLSRRQGIMAITGGDDPAVLEQLWERRKSLYEHLAQTAEHFWVAEMDGKIQGYARSILRGGHRELTELFILPEVQSMGIGRELFKRAFPDDGAYFRSIIASADTRAMSLYIKAKVYPRFPIIHFSRQPEKIAIDSDITIEAMPPIEEIIETLATIDLFVTGHRRDADHNWLVTDRQGFLYTRNGKPIGYGYIGHRSGPFALLDANDFPIVLAHAESTAASGDEAFGVEVPMLNTTAIDYLLGRGYRMDSFMAQFMSNEPFGRFENYLCMNPPFFY